MSMQTRPSVDTALDAIAEAARLLPTQVVPLRRCGGRISATAVFSPRSAPPYDTSAMDGYALHAHDIADRLATYKVGAAIAAGLPAERSCVRGVALPISTGAQVPAHCGGVVPLERVDVTADAIMVREAVVADANIRLRGEDAMAGDRVLVAGTLITPAIIGALAAFGVETVEVFRRPRVALLITGDELQGEIRDSNGPMIAAALDRIGAIVIENPVLRDTRADIAAAIDRACRIDRADLVISTGGVSVGAHDHVRAALESQGGQVRFHGVSMRPGKPVLFAITGTGALFFGLPGNPVAALVGMRFFVNHALRHMTARARETGRPVAVPTQRRAGTTLFLKARSLASGEGPAIMAGQQSHRMRPLIDADQWVVVRPDGDGFAASAYPLDIAV